MMQARSDSGPTCHIVKMGTIKGLEFSGNSVLLTSLGSCENPTCWTQSQRKSGATPSQALWLELAWDKSQGPLFPNGSVKWERKKL